MNAITRTIYLYAKAPNYGTQIDYWTSGSANLDLQSFGRVVAQAEVTFDIDITKHPHYQVDTAPPAQPAAQPLTDAQIEALVLETVYENDERIPYRDYWVSEIGMPFARAIERAHGIGSQP